MKIVSLLPSATEIVYALGLGDDLVGVTDECDYPPDAVTKPVVSRSALPQGRPLTSREIDEAVRRRMDAQRAALHPGHGPPPPRTARRDPHAGPLPRLRGAERAGAARAGRARACPTRRWSRSIRTRSRTSSGRSRPSAPCSTATSAAASIADRAPRPRVARVKEIATRLPTIRVFCLDWSDPPFVAGHWIPEMVEAAGGVNLLNAKGEPSTVVTWRQIRDAEPRGHRVHAVRLLPGGGRGGGRGALRPAGLRRHARGAQRQRLRGRRHVVLLAPGPADRGRPGDPGLGRPPRGLSGAAAARRSPV